MRAIRQQAWTMELSREARFNIDERLKTMEDQFNEAASLAARDSCRSPRRRCVVVPEQDVRVSESHRRSRPAVYRVICDIEWISSPSACQSRGLAMAAVYRCERGGSHSPGRRSRITKPTEAAAET